MCYTTGSNLKGLAFSGGGRCQKSVAFFGIIIRMYFDDHPPPHFHAIYGDSEAQVGINPIAILESNLPRRAVSMAVEWATLHQGELMANWQRLCENQPTEKIPPLD
jgi:hypothetical protein